MFLQGSLKRQMMMMSSFFCDVTVLFFLLLLATLNFEAEATCSRKRKLGLVSQREILSKNDVVEGGKGKRRWEQEDEDGKKKGNKGVEKGEGKREKQGNRKN